MQLGDINFHLTGERLCKDLQILSDTLMETASLLPTSQSEVTLHTRMQGATGMGWATLMEPSQFNYHHYPLGINLPEVASKSQPSCALLPADLQCGAMAADQAQSSNAFSDGSVGQGCPTSNHNLLASMPEGEPNPTCSPGTAQPRQG